ncbi:MAG: hypothetical protein ACP5N1_05460 [Candidatus Woesearchaeota archaeon]
MLEHKFSEKTNNEISGSLYSRVKTRIRDRIDNTLLNERILIAYSGMYSLFAGARTAQLYHDDQSIIGGLFFTVAFAGISIYTSISSAAKYNSFKKMNEDISECKSPNDESLDAKI